MKLLLLAPAIALYLLGPAQAPPVRGIGVVVKKNPGTGASRNIGTTNGRGIADIEITEKGNYVFTFLAPATNAAEPGNAAKSAFTWGGPVKSVKVGLGKNPPGGRSAMIIFVVPNEKGEIEYSLEPGKYQVLALENPQEPEKKDLAPGRIPGTRVDGAN